MQLLGSGTILREVIAAADLLRADFGVAADMWSCPSFTELAREAMAVERWNLLHPAEAPRKSHVETVPRCRRGPVVAATDYMRLFAEQIRAQRAAALPRPRHRRVRPLRLPQAAARLLRDRPALGRLAALKALADEGTIEPSVVGDAIARYGIDPEKPPPWTV